MREAGQLGSVEADVWDGAATWDYNGEFLGNLASALALSGEQVDQMFREAEAIQG